MRIAVLRVHCPTLNPSEFLERWELEAACVWNAGDIERGKPLATSGFTLDVADAQSDDELIASITDFLSANSAALERLFKLEASLVLDIGLTVGGNDQFTASTTLEPTVLAMLSTVGISLKVSSYPSSD